MSSLFWTKCFIKGSRGMGIEIVTHHSDFMCLWQMNINQVLHTISEILFCPACGDFHVPPTSQRLQEQKQVASALALLFVVITLRFARLYRQGLLFLVNQLIGNLIKADHRIKRVIGFSIQIQNIFHPPDKVSPNHGRNTPFLLDPRFQFVFFRTNLTAS
jgi:hypothetical protein